MPASPQAKGRAQDSLRGSSEQVEDAFVLANESEGDDSDHDGDNDENDDNDDNDYNNGESELRGLVAANTPSRTMDSVEPELDVLTALRVYRKAVFWCLVTSACVIMEGYDMIL